MCLFPVCRAFIAVTMVILCWPIHAWAAEAEKDLAAKIHRTVKAWQPTKDERLLDQVGWAASLEEAQQLAKEHARPLFVFTYSGSTARANAIALQRC